MSVCTKVVRYLSLKSDKMILPRLCTKRNYRRQLEQSPNDCMKKITHPYSTAVSKSTQVCGRMFIHDVSNAVDIEDEEDMEQEMGEGVAENSFAQKLFENSVHYKETTVQPFKAKMVITDDEARKILTADCSQMNPTEILFSLKKLSYHILNKPENLNSDDYINFLQALSTACDSFTNTELFDFIRHLLPLSTLLNLHPSYIKLCQVIDKICKNRLKTFTRTETFILCDMFSKLYYKKNILSSNFLWSATLRLGSKLNKLTAKNIVQLCYFLNLCRKTPLNMYELECSVQNCLNDISVDELGIVAMGFFKSKSPIRSTHVNQAIMQKVLENVNTINSVSLGSIMKLLRYSANPAEISLFRLVVQMLKPRIPTYNIMTNIHIAHACIKLLLPETDVLEIILNRFKKQLKNARLKDLERMVFIMSTLGYDSQHPLYKDILQELRMSYRQEEIIKFRRILPWTLQYLTYVNIYPLDLIQIVLDQNYIKDIYKKQNFYVLTREFIVLYYGLKIEVPDYKGPFLNDRIKDYLVDKYSLTKGQSKSKSTKLGHVISEIIHVSKNILKTDTMIYTTQLLPHVVSKQLIIAVDKDNNLVPPEPLLSSCSNDEIKFVNRSDLKDTKFVALTVIPISGAFRDMERLTGPTAMMLRQIQALGFLPFTIYQSEWEMLETTAKKEDYLKRVLEKVINS